ncbi:uncharacterized protein LOC127087020 [Lathyrus oleraceus]|uniref:uncharacterized protein LOC127087020 n=1 Tax=Pisum sativum TaxID=3888 RepID=UPI0021D24D04|nr:uncharacterized protein LOC127087020 [Pisum sativum]
MYKSLSFMSLICGLSRSVMDNNTLNVLSKISSVIKYMSLPGTEISNCGNKGYEHRTYMVYNGDHLTNELPLKIRDNPLKLFFNGGTTITMVDRSEILEHKFDFKPIVDFLHEDFQVNHLYDVIGVLHQVVKTQVAGRGRKACVNILLSDEIDYEIELTFWEAYINQFMPYKTKHTTHGHTIIIITHAMCQQSSTIEKLYISNAWNGSKLLLDFDHPLVKTLKSKLGDTMSSQVHPQQLSQPSASQGSFVDISFSYINDIKTICDFISLQHC